MAFIFTTTPDKKVTVLNANKVIGQNDVYTPNLLSEQVNVNNQTEITKDGDLNVNGSLVVAGAITSKTTGTSLTPFQLQQLLNMPLDLELCSINYGFWSMLDQTLLTTSNAQFDQGSLTGNLTTVTLNNQNFNTRVGQVNNQTTRISTGDTDVNNELTQIQMMPAGLKTLTAQQVAWWNDFDQNLDTTADVKFDDVDMTVANSVLTLNGISNSGATYDDNGIHGVIYSINVSAVNNCTFLSAFLNQQHSARPGGIYTARALIIIQIVGGSLGSTPFGLTIDAPNSPFSGTALQPGIVGAVRDFGSSTSVNINGTCTTTGSDVIFEFVDPEMPAETSTYRIDFVANYVLT